MRWFFLWLAAAVSTALGVMAAYLGPSLLPPGKAFAYSPLGHLMNGLPLPLVLVGLAGLVCSVAGIWWSQSRRPPNAIPTDGYGPAGSMTSRSRRSADIAARAGLGLAMAAFAGEIFFQVGLSIAPGSFLGAPGLAGFIPAVGLAAWPVALGASLISWPAVVLGTARRQIALFGLTLGSLTLVWLPAWFLRAVFGLSGGD